MRRTWPLEATEVDLGAGQVVVAPTEPEALRVKAYLVVQRRFVRDFLDVAALADHLGIERAVETLSELDDYYQDRSEEPGSALTSLVTALAAPEPRDPQVIAELHRYKNLADRWQDWAAVISVCEELALALSGATS